MENTVENHVPDLLVSVESRKGGVGKTTAALCLARLFQKKDYSVLFLDLDITGTNAADIANSWFWKNELFVIKENVPTENNDIQSYKQSNLISLFYKCFMAGKAVPYFSFSELNQEGLQIDLSRVNVFGSQIYENDTDNIKNDLLVTNKSNISRIAQPAIIFDSLHAYWLKGFIQQIIDNFMRVASTHGDRKSIVIIDNSPGYVGIAPVIHEWLTDLGPEKGKFLFITSLDTQDFRACEYAVYDLHNMFQNKLRISSVYRESLKKGKGVNLNVNDEAFFMKLATARNTNSLEIDPLAYYKSPERMDPSGVTNINNNIFNSANNYISAIINRVPKGIKSGSLSYELPLGMKQSENYLLKILSGGDNYRDVRERMVSYDEYIENQFLYQKQRRKRRFNKRQRDDACDLIDRIERLIKEEYRESNQEIIWTPGVDNNIPEKLESFISLSNKNIIEIKRDLEILELGHLSRLIHEEWLPGSIIPTFQRSIIRYLRECELPITGIIENGNYMEYDKKRRSDYNIVKSEINTYLLNKKIIRHVEKNDNTINYLITSMASLLTMATKFSLWDSNIDKEMRSIYFFVLALEINVIKRKNDENNRWKSLQNTLTHETLNRNEVINCIIKYESLWMNRNRIANENVNGIFDLYKACTAAQSRLIDVIADYKFLLTVIKIIVEKEIDSVAELPFIKGIVDDVIIKKTNEHEDATRRIAKEISNAEYYVEFEETIKDILKEWGKR